MIGGQYSSDLLGDVDVPLCAPCAAAWAARKFTGSSPERVIAPRVPRVLPGWSGREDDGSGGMAAGGVGECLGGVGEAEAGRNRDLQPPIAELRSRARARARSLAEDHGTGEWDSDPGGGLRPVRREQMPNGTWPDGPRRAEVAFNGGVLRRFDLTGRRAVVTGASRGLGRAFATALAEAGADVAAVARGKPEITQAAREISAGTGRRVVPITADVTVRHDVERMIAETATQLGGVDILVNNAGVCFHRPALEVPDSEWDQVFDTNVFGVSRRGGRRRG